MRTVFSLKNLSNVLWCVIVPLVVAIVLFSLFVFFYSLKNKQKNKAQTSYVINYWSSVLGIVFGAILLGVSIGFSSAFIVSSKQVALAVNDKVATIFFLVFPLIPLIFLLVFIRKFIKNLNNKKIVEKNQEVAHYEVN